MLRALILMAAIYTAGILPWPHWDAYVGECLASLGNGLVGNSEGQRIIKFEAPPQGVPLNFHVSVLVAEQRGSQYVGRRIGLDTRGLVWIPLLFGASAAVAFSSGPIRRFSAVFTTLILVGTFSATSLANTLALETAALGWWAPSGTLLAAMVWWDEISINQLGPGFIVPAVAAALGIGLASRLPSRPQPNKKGRPGAGGLVVKK